MRASWSGAMGMMCIVWNAPQGAIDRPSRQSSNVLLRILYYTQSACIRCKTIIPIRPIRPRTCDHFTHYTYYTYCSYSPILLCAHSTYYTYYAYWFSMLVSAAARVCCWCLRSVMWWDQEAHRHHQHHGWANHKDYDGRRHQQQQKRAADTSIENQHA